MELNCADGKKRRYADYQAFSTRNKHPAHDPFDKRRLKKSKGKELTDLGRTEMSIEVFIAEDSGLMRSWLRRFSSKSCPGPMGYHNARTLFEEEASSKGSEPPHTDPGWPTKCSSCDYDFETQDTWQLFTEILWGCREKLLPTSELPPGALFNAWWMGDNFKAPDGKCWALVLPPGGASDIWFIGGPASAGSGGGRWTITGSAPKFTARPSILTPRFHGFLTDGFLNPV